MAEIKKQMVIDIDEDILDIITAKQGDSGSRFLDVVLIRLGTPIDLTRHSVRFSALKPDKRPIYNDCKITDAANGRFQVEFTDQTLALSGNITAEFTIYSEDKLQTLTTRKFTITVQESLFDAEAILSTNEYGAAVMLFQDVAAVRNTINAISNNIGVNIDAKLSTRASQASLDSMRNEVLALDVSSRRSWMLEPSNNIKQAIGQIKVPGAGRNVGGNWIGRFAAPASGIVKITASCSSTITSTDTNYSKRQCITGFLFSDYSATDTSPVIHRSLPNIGENYTSDSSSTFADNRVWFSVNGATIPAMSTGTFTAENDVEFFLAVRKEHIYYLLCYIMGNPNEELVSNVVVTLKELHICYDEVML